MNKKLRILVLSFIFISPSLFPFFSYNSFTNSQDSHIHKDKPQISNGAGTSSVLVFFNKSYYNASVISNFTYHGGSIKVQWNDTFSNISGFAGTILENNITLFQGNITDAIIENDAVIEAQMNYATIQTEAVNLTWHLNGYQGDTNSSIAVLDTGIDPNHIFFPDGYNSENLSGNIVGWEDVINNTTNPSDDNGHGTFLSSVIAGTGTDYWNKTAILTLDGLLNHSYLFNFNATPTNYSIFLTSLNATIPNSNILINSTWSLIDGGIDNVWFDLYYNGSKVNSLANPLPDQINQLNHSIAQNTGFYNIFLVYRKSLIGTYPLFTYNANISFIPEIYNQNYSYFTGIANASKIVSYKILNQTGIGYASDLISALESVIQNKSKYQIVSVCLSVATFEENISFISSIIDNVIENGILVVIAAGNQGIRQASDPLNSLATNKNAIVVGAINDQDQITSYSSRGKDVGGSIIKPDIVAPGGSVLPDHRSIIGADANSNSSTIAYGTSIATAIVSAALNILIESKWGDWNQWQSIDMLERVKLLKSILLMTASETNLLREDDPTTSANEALESPTTSIRTTLFTGIKDVHEGYGRINIQAAIDALNKYVTVEVNETINGTLISSEVDPFGPHVYARRIILNKSISYTFNLTVSNQSADFDLFLFSNKSDQYGEPVLLGSSKKWYAPNSNQFYFTPNQNQTESILIVKAVTGESFFEVYISNISNQFDPILSVPEVTYPFDVKNTTVLSYQDFIGNPQDANYTLDQYLFFIKYSDNDTSNAPPADIYVSIAGIGNYTLTRYNPLGETNFTEGVTYWSSQINFSTDVIYNYVFYANDGVHFTRYPIAGSLSIQITAPVLKSVPYEYTFNGDWDGDAWKATGTGWHMLTQRNGNDNRFRNYPDPGFPFPAGWGIWNSIYFGTNYIVPQNYTYQPYLLGDSLNGSVYSPWFNLTGLSNPIVKFGLRTSLNFLDSIDLYITYDRWGQEDLLRSYTNEEREWFMDEFNLSKYEGDLIQFRFEADVDILPDTVRNRGFMLDHVFIGNYTNIKNATLYSTVGVYPDSSLWSTVTPSALDGGGSRFQQFAFTCEYQDTDNNYPEYMRLQFGLQGGLAGPEFDMINIYGDWSANSTSIEERGILFQKKVVVGTISNRTFRFVYSDGVTENQSVWYNEPNDMIIFSNPTPKQYNVQKDGVNYSYAFSNTDLSDYYVAGIPTPQQYTAWLPADNTWHPINFLGQDLLFCGEGEISFDFGYGPNWYAELMTYPLYVRGDHDVFFEFKQNTTFSFDPEPQPPYTDKDGGNPADVFYVSISTDYGDNWVEVPGLEYYYDMGALPMSIKLDINNYADKVVMIKFTVDSNGIDTPLFGLGWRVFDIKIGYDQATDFVDPIVTILSPEHLDTVSAITTIKAQLSDNVGIDESRISIYIDDVSVDRTLHNYDNQTGILTFDWDTTFNSDGILDLKIVTFDEEGNRAEAVITIAIDNGLIAFNKWWPWILFIFIAILVGLAFYIFAEKKGKYMVQDVKVRKIEKERKKEFEYQKAKIIIDKLSHEEELKRPNTLYCKSCKAWFYSDKFDIMCPLCERDQVYAAYNCESCNKWYYFDSPGEENYCPKCSPVEIVESEKKLGKKKKEINKRLGIRLIKRDLENVEEILAEKGKFLRDFNIERKERKYSILD
jgi:hypothetical protein